MQYKHTLQHNAKQETYKVIEANKKAERCYGD